MKLQIFYLVLLNTYRWTLVSFEDRFDIEGQVTGFGNPDWAATHEAATETCPAVKVLVDGGAKCIGKVHMDELAYR
jgi:amidase